jgi:hypothetical protein
MVSFWSMCSMILAGFFGVVAQATQRFGHGLVDDLEQAAADQLLVFHKRDVRLDARCVTVHHKGNRAGYGVSVCKTRIAVCKRAVLTACLTRNDKECQI